MRSFSINQELGELIVANTYIDGSYNFQQGEIYFIDMDTIMIKRVFLVEAPFLAITDSDGGFITMTVGSLVFRTTQDFLTLDTTNLPISEATGRTWTEISYTNASSTFGFTP